MRYFPPKQLLNSDHFVVGITVIARQFELSHICENLNCLAIKVHDVIACEMDNSGESAISDSETLGNFIESTNLKVYIRHHHHHTVPI